MDAQQFAKLLAVKATAFTKYRGVIGVARFEDGELHIRCVPFNSENEFYEEKMMRENDPEFDPAALEQNLMCFAAADVSETFAEFLNKIFFMDDEDDEDVDEDILLSDGDAVPCSYVLDTNTVVAVVLSPYAPVMEEDIIQKMKM